jgi:hypothetical protein
MKPDPIVAEVRAARAAIAEAFGFDRSLHIAYAREQTRLHNEALGRGEPPPPLQPIGDFLKQHAPAPQKAPRRSEVKTKPALA